jgi:adenylate cyclase
VVSDDEPNPFHNQIVARLMLAGVSPERIADASTSDELLTLIRATVLWGGEDMITLAELAERAGIDIELCRRARMLLGLPDPGDEPLCRDEEVTAFQGLAAGISVFGEEPVLQFARVIGFAMATIGEGALSVFARALGDGQQPGVVGDDAYTLASFDALEAFDVVPQVLRILVKLQFDLATDRLRVDPGQQQTAAIGFVDLTSSTSIGEKLGTAGMAVAVSRFEERAVELAVTCGGRVVKFIGDEVMFVAPELDQALAVARGLLDHVAEDPSLKTARGGVAHGEVLSRDGDWFGPAVNLAKRLSEKAKANEVLFTGDRADEIEGASVKGRRRYRGVTDKVEVWYWSGRAVERSQRRGRDVVDGEGQVVE